MGCVLCRRGSTREEVRVRRGWRPGRLALEPEDKERAVVRSGRLGGAVSDLGKRRSPFGDCGGVGVTSSFETLRGVIVLAGHEMCMGLQELQWLGVVLYPQRVFCHRFFFPLGSPPRGAATVVPRDVGMNTGVSQQEGGGLA